MNVPGGGQRSGRATGVTRGGDSANATGSSKAPGRNSAGPREDAGDRPGCPSPAEAGAPLTGRDHEVSLLKDRWEQAQEGMGQVVLLVGEPGLGKSRLVATIRQHVLDQAGDSSGAAPHSAIVEWRCSQHFQNTGLYPACEFLERFLGAGRDEAPAERFDRLAGHLIELGLDRPRSMALFASLLLIPPDGHFQPHGLTPVREREETFNALREWLCAYSARQPVLFVVEDLHWVDASTLEFLGRFIAEGLHDRIMTVLTFRPEFKTPWPAVAHQTSLALNRLTRRQVRELLRKNAERELPDSLIEQICERTGGVPLFVEELSKMVRAPSVARGAAEGVLENDMPVTLQDLVLSRVDRVASGRRIAQLAATIGREFRHDLIAAVDAGDGDMLGEELTRLVHGGILQRKGIAPRCTYVFKHSLLEDALRDALPEGERRRYHQRIAETLRSQSVGAAGAPPEIVAHHFMEGETPEQAIGYLLKAGLRSRLRFANVEAIGHLTKGLEMLNTLEETPERDARELELLNPLGTAYIAARGYGAPEVGPVFARARELCKRIGQPAQLFANTWGEWVWHLVRGDLRLCAELAAEAVALAERAGDPGMLMEALFLPVVTATFRGEFSTARDACELALQLDDRERTRHWAGITGEDSGVAHRCYLSVALWHLGFPHRAFQVNQEALALARAIDQPFTLAFALEHRAWLHNQARIAPEASAAAEEEISIATEQGYAYWLASASLFKADAMVVLGEGAEAFPALVRGVDDLRITGAAIDLTLHFGFLGEAYMQAGKPDDAARALDEGLAVVEASDERFFEAELHRLRGEMHLAGSGGQGAAEASFKKAIEIAKRQQSKAWELRATTGLARLWRQQGRPDEARAALAGACDVYKEGLETPDLANAKALLEVLGNERMRHDLAGGIKYVLGCIPPPMEGAVSVDWRYVPSSTLGGDTIGYHWIDDDHLAIYLVDVTGHGLDSALLSVTITNVLRSGSLPGADMRRPDQVLAALNDAFPNESHGEKYFTIWYGVYEKSSATLAWSGGGHHPSILLREGEPTPVLLESSGPMMGAARGMEYPSKSCRTSADSRLVVFSDGVFEILRDGKIQWTLEKCIEHLAHPSVREQQDGALMDQLLAHVRRIRGSTQLEDDFSIIVARFRQPV
jgi:predicted ATPase